MINDTSLHAQIHCAMSLDYPFLPQHVLPVALLLFAFRFLEFEAAHPRHGPVYNHDPACHGGQKPVEPSYPLGLLDYRLI